MEELKKLNIVFQRDFFAQQRLSVFISTDSLCFFNYNELNEITRAGYSKLTSQLALKNHLTTLKQDSNNSTFNVFFLIPSFVLLPRRFFSFGNEKQLISANHEISNLDLLFTDFTKNGMNVVLYSVEERQEKIIRAVLEKCNCHHSLLAIWDSCENYDDGIYFFYFVNSIIITVIKRGILQFAQVYSIDKKEDLIYYISFISKHFELLKNKISMLGFVDEENEDYQFIKKFHPQLKLFGNSISENLKPFI